MKNLCHKHITQPPVAQHALNPPATPRALGIIAAGLGLAFAVAGVTIWKHFRKSDTHFVKTSAGLARIHTIEDEQGNPVRVLEQNGAYESATYLDKNYPVPVFAYQQAFDHVFEATLFDNGFTNNQVLMIGGGATRGQSTFLTLNLTSILTLLSLINQLPTSQRSGFTSISFWKNSPMQ